MRAASHGPALLSLFSIAADSSDFLPVGSLRTPHPGMEQLGDLELLMEKGFGEEAESPAER